MRRFVDEEDEDETPVGTSPEFVVDSTNPADLANAAIDAAWKARRQMDVNGVKATRYAGVSRAFSHAVDAAMQTQDAIKETAELINPHQRIGVLSDDEIDTVMALRRGTAKVYPVSETDEEPFQTWATRQIEKLAAAVRDIDARTGVPHAGEAVDPLGIAPRMNQTNDPPMPDIGRAVWAMMEASAVDSQVIPVSIWEASKYGQVSITAFSDGARIIRRS